MASRFGLFLLVNIFSALLPPNDPSDRDFYEVLGLIDDGNNDTTNNSNSNSNSNSKDDKKQKKNEQQSSAPQRSKKNKRSITVDEIRKAYRKKSLQLHPDKIAQRRQTGITQEEAAAEYELVQEAYGVLNDRKLRKKYHTLQCSPSKYRFIQNNAFANPTALQENLTKANFRSKTRLVLLVFIILSLPLLQPLLIAVKVNHLLDHNNHSALDDTPWVILLIPWWLMHGLYIVLLAAMTLYVILQSSKKAKNTNAAAAAAAAGLDATHEDANGGEDITDEDDNDSAILMLLALAKQMAWLTAEVFLALKWDNEFLDHDYVIVFTPLYIGMVLQWIELVATMFRIRADIGKMVSEKYFREHVLNGRNLHDVPEQERKQLEKQFFIVHPPEDVEQLFAVIEPDDDPEMVEAIKEAERVEASQEYITAASMLYETKSQLFNSFVFGIIFFVLLTLKLDHVALHTSNWWIIFIPIWILLGSRMAFSMLMCCCYAPEVDLAMAQKEMEKDRQNENNQNDNDHDNENDNHNNSNDDNNKDNEDNHPESEPATTADTAHNNHHHDNGTSTQKQNGANDDADSSEFTTSIEYGNIAATMLNSNGQTTSEEQHDDKKEETKDSNSSAIKTSNGPDTGNGDHDDNNDDDGSIELEFDEDTFHAWQSAYAEAENIGMEKRVKAQGVCCFTCFQLIILVLFVAKLNVAYNATRNNNDDNDADFDNNDKDNNESDKEILDNDSDNDDIDVGFNAIWILFPFLFFAGIILCCFACLIYCAGSLAEVAAEAKEELDKENQQGQEEFSPDGQPSQPNTTPTAAATTIMMPPPPPPTETTLHPTTDHANQPPPPPQQQQPQQDQIAPMKTSLQQEAPLERNDEEDADIIAATTITQTATSIGTEVVEPNTFKIAQDVVEDMNDLD